MSEYSDLASDLGDGSSDDLDDTIGDLMDAH